MSHYESFFFAKIFSKIFKKFQIFFFPKIFTCYVILPKFLKKGKKREKKGRKKEKKEKKEKNKIVISFKPDVRFGSNLARSICLDERIPKMASKPRNLF